MDEIIKKQIEGLEKSKRKTKDDKLKANIQKRIDWLKKNKTVEK